MKKQIVISSFLFQNTRLGASLIVLYLFFFSASSGCWFDYSKDNESDASIYFDSDEDFGIDNGTDGYLATDTSFSESGETETENDNVFSTESGTGYGSCPASLTLALGGQFTTSVVSEKPAEEFIDTCPDGQFIVGFEGFLRDYDLVHGRFRAICGIPSIRLIDNQCIVEIASGGVLPMRALGGEVEWQRRCSKNEIVVGLEAWSGKNISQTIFHCAPLLVRDNGSNFVIVRGDRSELEPVSTTDTGQPNFSQDCPAGQVATTTKLQADRFLRAIGLGCQQPKVEMSI